MKIFEECFIPVQFFLSIASRKLLTEKHDHKCFMVILEGFILKFTNRKRIYKEMAEIVHDTKKEKTPRLLFYGKIGIKVIRIVQCTYKELQTILHKCDHHGKSILTIFC